MTTTVLHLFHFAVSLVRRGWGCAFKESGSVLCVCVGGGQIKQSHGETNKAKEWRLQKPEMPLTTVELF
jgi:hypothetical protein